LYSRMGVPLTGVTARLATSDAKVACIENSTIVIGDLADRTLLTSSDAFRFTLADVNRNSVSQEFSVEFEIAMSADQFEKLPFPQRTILTLDLDAVGGTGATTFFEGFENGLGSFEPMALDEDLNPPDDDLGNLAAGVANSDGYRCQYNDPDWEQTWTSSNSSAAENCFPNQVWTPDAFYFQTTADRAYSGTRALYWGVVLDETLGFTTPSAQLEAVRTTDPINLGWHNICDIDRSLTCEDELDCPIGQECVSATPSLSFKHQVSFVDHRILGMSRDDTAERGIVQIQRVDTTGVPIGNWERLEPHINVYDTAAFPFYWDCTFDPVDDGNDEEDFFDPSDPLRKFGPSSTCSPQRCFVSQGDTEQNFDTELVGDASDGPGVRGIVGNGVWVEPKFSLQRYRGERVRLRFLQTGIKVVAVHTWQDFFQFNPNPVDDGWFIDEVVISDTLTGPATVSVDEKENLDLDGSGSVCDCAPADTSAWAFPGEVEDLTLFHSGGVAGVTTLTWSPPNDLGATSVDYDVLVSSAPDGFDSEGLATCLDTANPSLAQALDPVTPDSGTVRYLLVRATHACGGGPIGETSAGDPRVGVPCF
jgi:hypothetical protein